MIGAALLALLAADGGAALPDPPALDLPPPGTHVARTMALLASASPTRRPVVRIAVYGQSISKQAWSAAVHAELARRYPHAELIFRNLAIGGFAAPMLERPLEHDLLPLHPDLVIFHVYGNQAAYERIIRQIRSRTAAEVMVQNDFVAPSQQRQDHHDQHSWVWLPELARRYRLELVDVRRGWIEHLRREGLAPAALVGPDRTHLNDRGSELMAALTLRHLVHDPARPSDPQGLVRALAVGRDARWRGRRLELPFEGNRVDLVGRPSPGAAPLRVRVDGRAPSQHPELYTVSRPNADPNRDWPWQVGAVTHVDRRAPLLLEDWTVRFTSVEEGARAFTFDVTGSVTGFDGSGRSDEPFVSRSGRVVLSPADWFIERAAGKPFGVKFRPGYTVTWRVEPRFADTWSPPAWVAPGRDGATTVAQGLPNGKHRLVLEADGPGPLPALEEIRVYRPPLADRW